MDLKTDRVRLRSDKRVTVMINNYTKLFEASSPLIQNPKQDQYFPQKNKAKNTQEKSFFYPSNLELIQKIQKFKSIDEPFSISASSRTSPYNSKPYLGYSKTPLTMQSKSNERKNFLEYELPEDPEKLDKLLRTIKETERVIRQENEFIYKVRKYKPKIQLKFRERNKSEAEGKGCKVRKRRNNTPIPLGRSGILVKSIVIN